MDGFCEGGVFCGWMVRGGGFFLKSVRMFFRSHGCSGISIIALRAPCISDFFFIRESHLLVCSLLLDAIRRLRRCRSLGASKNYPAAAKGCGLLQSA